MLKRIKELEQRLASLGKTSFVNYEQYLEKHPYTNQAPSDFLISEKTKEQHPNVAPLLTKLDKIVTEIEGAHTGAPYHSPAPEAPEPEAAPATAPVKR